MKNNHIVSCFAWSIRLIAAVGLAGLLAACEGDSEGSSSSGQRPSRQSSSSAAASTNATTASAGSTNVVSPKNAGVILFMGDSVTTGSTVPDAAYPSRIQSATGKTVINAAVGGQRSVEGLNRIRGLIDKHRPGTVAIMYGINDIIHGPGVEGAADNLRKMVRIAKQENCRVLLATIPPRYRGDGIWDTRHTDLNARIRSIARGEGARLVDVEREFGQNPDLLQEDGFHPNTDGNRIIGALFFEALR
ncbi:MAG TPA: GDSL-type esterase/lipase family protein [Kiritimatiellia bacterium]|nr:GDSL-type esterase/lipase family protein [Kiritimatiellia bacterium]